MIAAAPQHPGESLDRGGPVVAETESPTAQPHQEALRNLGSAVMGSRKTGSESGLELGKREQSGLFPARLGVLVSPIVLVRSYPQVIMRARTRTPCDGTSGFRLLSVRGGCAFHRV